MIPTFTDPAANRLWEDYFVRVNRLLTDLEAHVADSLIANAQGTEMERLQSALARLGQPEEYLRPLLADDLINRGMRTYAPLTIIRGLFHALLTGSRRAATACGFSLGYLCLAIFVAIAVLKPVWRDHVGVFQGENGKIRAGIFSLSGSDHDMLGWWTTPIALLLAALVYMGLTKSLRALRHQP
ncbi:hypothetical protein [Gluconobacter cerinus]|uniref:hypothetical protein n=1 Tax=Gluconobacter cerinus TaxID=38307 RepID=UPI001B8ABABB|nr:hypothetical protein [Gluconobacter cerinus]MBS0984544.1 hypothetical protein [Gluconobacter cerinus]